VDYIEPLAESFRKLDHGAAEEGESFPVVILAVEPAPGEVFGGVYKIYRGFPGAIYIDGSL
jgi:hypothetical protein